MGYLHSPYDDEARICQESYVHTTAADALASCVIHSHGIDYVG